MHDVVKKSFFKWPHILNSLLKDAKKPLYPNYTKFTWLFFVVHLFNLKMGNGWSGKNSMALLERLTDMLPKGNKFSDYT